MTDAAPDAGLDRRRALRLLLGAGVVTAAACSSGGSSASDATATTAAAPTTTGGSSDTTVADCSTAIPEETAGPFPGDGSNGPDALGTEGVVREDIRSSFGGATGTADGAPLSIRLRVADVGTCAPVAGAAVYAWHCDRDGGYSLYSPGLEDVNYLRGVAVTDADGTATFTSVFPGCYPGRWPHVHLEVYPDADAATGGGRPVATSQLAFPRGTCEAVYATAGYDTSRANLARISLATDGVFGDDGGVHQLATVRGDADAGYEATLSVPIRS